MTVDEARAYLIPEPGQAPVSSASLNDDYRVQRAITAVETYVSETSEWRLAFETHLTRDEAGSLDGLARWGSALAVRRADPTILARSALAISLSSVRTSDERDTLVRATLPYMTARKMDIDPHQVYRQAVAVASDRVRTWAENFLARADALSQPRNFLYRECPDEFGFWWCFYY